MRIDGKQLAQDIFLSIKQRTQKLPHGVTPTLAIITVGEESSWETYVAQKQKRAQDLGFNTSVISLSDPEEESLIQTINRLNKEITIHGIIVQRPLPKNLNSDVITHSINKEKDVDGFRPDSPFQPPIWLAVKHILEFVYENSHPTTPFPQWINSQSITVLGKGETAGKPVIKGLYDMGIIAKVVDSKTPDQEFILKNSDIIISGVGKTVIQASSIKPKAILVGIGIRREDTVLKGDYDESSIENIASWYTPTPGGVGRVNLAFLMSNLLEAAELQSQD